MTTIADFKTLDLPKEIEPLEIQIRPPKPDDFPTGADLATSGRGAYRELVIQCGVEDAVIAIGEQYVGTIDTVVDLLIDPSWIPGWDHAQDALALRARVVTYGSEGGGTRFAASSAVGVYLPQLELFLPYRRLAFQVRANDQVFGIIELGALNDEDPETATLQQVLDVARRFSLTAEELAGFRSLLDDAEPRPEAGAGTVEIEMVDGLSVLTGILEAKAAGTLPSIADRPEAEAEVWSLLYRAADLVERAEVAMRS